MQKGKTLWEMWTERSEPKLPDVYNPIAGRIGSMITIDDVEFSKCDFVVEVLEEVSRTIEGRIFKFTDYVLRDRADGGLLRLRINPADPPVAGVPHSALLLRLVDEFAFSDDFLAVVNDKTNQFNITDDKTKTTEEYWRINNVSGSYACDVAVIKAVNQDGSVDEGAVSRAKLEYWDFWREFKDEAGRAFRQFVFVQMSGDNGWCQILKGEEIDPQRVMVI